MKYLFKPNHPGAIPASERGGSESMRSGNVYDVDPEWAAIVCEGCEGLDGADCLIAVVDENDQLPLPLPPVKGRKKKTGV